MKVVFNDVKTGKSYQKELENDLFIGRKIGDKIEGNVFGLGNYEFLVTGGSDSAGFPHRRDVEGSSRKKVLSGKSVGIKKKINKGVRIRKGVMGNTFSANTAQVNLKVVKYGENELSKVLGAEKEAEKPEEEKPKEEKKSEIKEKVEEKPKTEEKPVTESEKEN